MHHRRPTLLGLALVGLAVTGCVGLGPDDEASTASPTAAVTVNAAPAPRAAPTSGASATADPSAARDTAPATASAVSVASPSAAPDVVGPLTLASFDEPDTTWREAVFSIVDAGEVRGIATDRLTCGTGYGVAELELPLRDGAEYLSFSVAQSTAAERGDQRLVVRVLGDHESLEIQRVPFQQVKHFTVSVKDRSSARIQVSLDEELDTCALGRSHAVLFDARLH